MKEESNINQTKIAHLYTALQVIETADKVIAQKVNYLADKTGYEVYIITDSSKGNLPTFPLSIKVQHIDLKRVVLQKSRVISVRTKTIICGVLRTLLGYSHGSNRTIKHNVNGLLIEDSNIEKLIHQIAI